MVTKNYCDTNVPLCEQRMHEHVFLLLVHGSFTLTICIKCFREHCMSHAAEETLFFLLRSEKWKQKFVIQYNSCYSIKFSYSCSD